MRKVILTLAVLVLLVSTLTTSAPPTCAAGDCQTLRTVCYDIWMDGMQKLCLATGTRSASQCFAEALQGFDNCVASGGCQLLID